MPAKRDRRARSGGRARRRQQRPALRIVAAAVDEHPTEHASDRPPRGGDSRPVDARRRASVAGRTGRAGERFHAPVDRRAGDQGCRHCRRGEVHPRGAPSKGSTSATCCARCPSRAATWNAASKRRSCRSPKQEIQRVRFQHIRELLAETDLPIHVVARAAGFEYSEHMITRVPQSHRHDPGPVPGGVSVGLRVNPQPSYPKSTV